MKKLSEDDNKKVHPWRFCGIGEHAVRTHPLHIPPSKSNPEGEVTTRHFHCAHNPLRKDIFTPIEIHAVAQRHFSRLKGPPCSLPLKFKNGSEFDDLIRGWTRYWNEVLNPKEPLDPNLVKALIASESGFKIKSGSTKKSRAAAWGLMQLLPDAVRILGDEHGELKDHYVDLTRKDLLDPNLSICGGIRWLFQKNSFLHPIVLAEALTGKRL
jgi:hypothetical protein